MKTGTAILWVAGLVALLPTSQIYGLSTHIIENFASYTVTGGDDDPTNPGDGNPNNWGVVETDPTNTQVRAEGYGGGQALRILNPEPSFVSVGRFFGPTSNETFSLDYKVLFNSTTLNTNSGGVRTLLGGPGNTTPVALYMRPYSAGFIAVSSNFTSHIMVSDIIEDDWYQVNIRIDAAAGLWDVAVSNLNSMAVGQAASLTNLTFNGVTPSYFSAFTITDNAGALVNRFDATFDDIRLIPEPSSIAMLSIGVVLLTIRRGRTPSH